MSAPAPALANGKRRIAVVRLADPAVAVAWVSVVFGLLLVFLPVSFPHTIIQNWENGRLTPVMVLFTVLLDLAIYLRIVHKLVAKPSVLASISLGLLPPMITVGLSFLLQWAIATEFSGYITNVQARVQEEVVFHTYFALVSAVFVPFLLVRLIQHSEADSH